MGGLSNAMLFAVSVSTIKVDVNFLLMLHSFHISCLFALKKDLSKIEDLLIKCAACE
jgi:hypothetical protein